MMRLFYASLFMFTLSVTTAAPTSPAATWPPGGATPSPITARMRLPGARFVPSTRRWNQVWADQLIPSNISAAQLKFAAEHYAATQKIWSNQVSQFRAFNPNFLCVMYHLAAGLNPEHNDDCPNPKSNSGSGFIGVVAPDGYVDEYTNYFRPWIVQKGVGDDLFEQMFQHYDTVDAAHRVWHNDPAWLMNLQSDVWTHYVVDVCNEWMQGNDDDGCFFDVAVETNSSLYNPKLSNPAPGNFDWWAPPHGAAGDAAQTATRAKFAQWMNGILNLYFTSVWKGLHGPGFDHLVIPNTDQMVTTVYDPTWTDGGDGGETIDGAMMEGFGNYTGQDMWLTLDRCVRHITGRGKILIAQCYGLSEQERLRRTAMYMLVKNENSFINILNADGVEWYPEYEIDLGDQHPLPSTLDSMRVAGQGWQSVWKRDYDRGEVLVNTSDAAIAVNVNASTRWAQLITHGGGKVGDDGTLVAQSIDTVDVGQSVTVAPSSGMILIIRSRTALVEEKTIPTQTQLHITPNPVDGPATITFTLEHSSHVRITITDVLGREVACVADGMMVAGEQRVLFASTDFLAAGEYFVKMTSAMGTSIEQMHVMRSR